jgi:hypothetical protein
MAGRGCGVGGSASMSDRGRSEEASALSGETLDRLFGTRWTRLFRFLFRLRISRVEW